MTFGVFFYAAETLKLKMTENFNQTGGKMQTGDNRKRSHRPITRHVRAEFTAAVRYPDGRRELFRVRNAVDVDDARAVVLAELGQVAALLIAPRRQGAGSADAG